jgi:hypothetical protein
MCVAVTVMMYVPVGSVHPMHGRGVPQRLAEQGGSILKAETLNSLVSKGDGGVHSHGSSGRDIGCGHGHRAHEGYYCEESHGIGRTHPIELARYCSSDDESGCEAKQEPT